jgi:hypothetical protein
MTGFHTKKFEALAGSFDALLRQRHAEAIRSLATAPAEMREEAYRYLHAVASAMEAFHEKWKVEDPQWPVTGPSSEKSKHRHLRLVEKQCPE